jgi:hypothetical protein
MPDSLLSIQALSAFLINLLHGVHSVAESYFRKHILFFSPDPQQQDTGSEEGDG